MSDNENQKAPQNSEENSAAENSADAPCSCGGHNQADHNCEKDNHEKKAHHGGKCHKAAAQAYAKAQQSPEAVAEILSEALAEVKEEMAEQEQKPTNVIEPDYRLIAQKTAAEFDNYRKRVAREKETWKREALGDFLKEFLPAFDDLDRAIVEGEKGLSYEVIHNGAQMVRDNLWKALAKAGVCRIDAADKKFDPRFHEAMTMIPMPGKEPDTVIEVFQSGYTLGDFVLRPAKVVVCADA